MARFRPELYEGGIYHIYNRGAAKLPIFNSDDDYHDFQDILRYFLIGFPKPKENTEGTVPSKKHNRSDWSGPVSSKASPEGNGLFRTLINLIAYCLMPNHFHFLIQLKNPEGNYQQTNGRYRTFQSVPEFMKRVGVAYSHKFNRRHKREGALFQGEYKIKLIPTDDYVIQVARYIHINAVAAGLVKKPEKWLWSDYHPYTSPEALTKYRFTKPDLILSYFKGNRSEYVKFINESMSEEIGELGKYTIDHDE